MIIHYAFFRWRPELSEPVLAELRQGFAALQESIPEIKSLRWVANNSPEGLDRGFKEGVRIELDDSAARQRYLEHPAHRGFAAASIIPALEHGLDSVLVFDYEEAAP